MKKVMNYPQHKREQEVYKKLDSSEKKTNPNDQSGANESSNVVGVICKNELDLCRGKNRTEERSTICVEQRCGSEIEGGAMKKKLALMERQTSPSTSPG